MSSNKRGTPAVSVLEVLLGNDLVGTLTHVPNERTFWAFDSSYTDNPTRPTLSLSFKAASGGLRTSTKPTSLKLPPFFSNVLPEGHLRDYLAAKGPVNPEREFFLLWLLGEDLPGAIRVRPVSGQPLPPTVSEAAKEADGDAVDELLRFSLAGVQLKFSAMVEPSGGLTIPARGVGGTWIAKLPSARFRAVPENEFVMLKLAAAAGIVTPEARLVPLDKFQNIPRDTFTSSGPALVVRRFDRGADGARIHMEDFAQVFGVFPHDKYKNAGYEDVARVLWAETGEAGVAEFTRRLVMTALIGNADMHLKNWSLLYPDRRTPVLSPAYDLVSTVSYIKDDEMALSLGGSKSFMLDEERLLRFAQRSNLPDRIVNRVAVETAERVRDAWTSLPEKELLLKESTAAIDAQMRLVPLGQ